MRLFLKKVFILIICLVFLPSGTFAQESISGCILIERYKLDYKQNYTKYQMHLRLKGGFTVMANLDNSGRFKFETSERLENFDIIFWDGRTLEDEPNVQAPIIFPAKVVLKTAPPYKNLFEYNKVGEIHFREKSRILSNIKSGEFDLATQALNRLESLYELLGVSKKAFYKNKAASLIIEMSKEAKNYRRSIGLSQYDNSKISIERFWLRKAINGVVDELNDRAFSRLIVAANNWALFARQTYSDLQRIWPSQSLDAIQKDESLFRKKDYITWLTEDILLLKETFEDERVLKMAKAMIQDTPPDLLTGDVRLAVQRFPQNIPNDYIRINVAELSNLLNGLNQIRKTNR